MVAFRGLNWLFEIKPKGKKITFTDDEKDFQLAWNGQYAVIQSTEDAMDIMNLIPNLKETRS